jgi:hypothetical protein
MGFEWGDTSCSKTRYDFLRGNSEIAQLPGTSFRGDVPAWIQFGETVSMRGFHLMNPQTLVQNHESLSDFGAVGSSGQKVAIVAFSHRF